MDKEQRHTTKPTKDDLLSPKQPSELKKRYQHDEFCKDNLRDLDKARKFLKWLFKPEITGLLDLDRLELSSESFLDEELKKLYADVLYRIPVRDRDESVVVFVLIELKTESDKWTVFQQVKYVVRIWDEEYRKAEKEGRLGQFLLPMVIPVIFHHGEQKFTASTELIDQVRTLQGLEPYTLNVKSLLCDVTTLHEEEFPADLELTAMFMMLQAAFSKNVAERLMRIYKKLRPNLHDPAFQRLWEDCLYYAMSSAKYFTKQDCKAIITEIRSTGDPIMATTEFISVADQFVEEGIAIGKAEGIAIGEAKVAEAKAEERVIAKAEIARNMKQKGYSAKDIADLTGLSSEEIDLLD
jgi:predicted transposase/invertase (TIGR01784 family)